MKPASAKAKGRSLQKWTRDTILELFPELTADDVRSTAMGQGGEDVQLSQTARTFLPFNIECKNKRTVAVINWLEKQAAKHGDHIPLVVTKQNHSEPVVVVDAKLFFEWVRQWNFPNPSK